MAKVIVLMGVSGCGKTSVGRALSAKTGWPFYDGDDFHPPENIAKMSNGIPLNDDDRAPWLARLHNLIAEQLAQGQSAILACSALKRKYREQLKAGNQGTIFVYLKGNFELIWARMAARKTHYMKASMLQSQFDNLEAPDAEEALVVDISADVNSIAEAILQAVDRTRLNL
jgi:gluconokinase